MSGAAVPRQINLVVADLERAQAFYRLLGWELVVTPGGQHAEAYFGELSVEFDTPASVALWNSGKVPDGPGSTLLGLTVARREDVDGLYAAVLAAGHAGQQPPYDAFWGSRYAVVLDPDGHQVGLASPAQEARRFWPPAPPPAVPA